jgi:serine/threonine protein kinase
LEKGPLPTKTLLRHAIEIAEAMENAHRRGVVHRDLKPANIVLTKSGAKLLDFGLAKWSATGTSEAETLKTLTGTPERLTEEGTILGTLRYMAPERNGHPDGPFCVRRGFVRDGHWSSGVLRKVQGESHRGDSHLGSHSHHKTSAGESNGPGAIGARLSGKRS